MNVYRAIVTKYLPATDTRGSRVKAATDGGSFATGYRDDLNPAEAHEFAARALADRMGIKGNLVAGELHPRGYVFLVIPDPK